MKSIDFSQLEVETAIGVFEKADLRSALGNIIYQRATTLEQDALARSIFGAPENQTKVFSDDEYAAMMQAFKAAGVLYPVIRAIEKQVEPKPKGNATA